MKKVCFILYILKFYCVHLCNFYPLHFYNLVWCKIYARIEGKTVKIYLEMNENAKWVWQAFWCTNIDAKDYQEGYVIVNDPGKCIGSFSSTVSRASLQIKIKMRVQDVIYPWCKSYLVDIV